MVFGFKFLHMIKLALLYIYRDYPVSCNVLPSLGFSFLKLEERFANLFHHPDDGSNYFQ